MESRNIGAFHVHTALQGPRRVLAPEELAERAARGPICPTQSPPRYG